MAGDETDAAGIRGCCSCSVQRARRSSRAALCCAYTSAAPVVDADVSAVYVDAVAMLSASRRRQREQDALISESRRRRAFPHRPAVMTVNRRGYAGRQLKP